MFGILNIIFNLWKNAKLFIHITDPVGRLYSQITQIFRPEMARIRFRLKEYKSVDEAIKTTIRYIKKWNSTESVVESYIQVKTTLLEASE